MRIAVIGSGISGMTAAYLLSEDHEVVVYEANDYIGGHTNTVDVNLNGDRYAVDTGFIVFNEQTYPNFIKLMNRLGVDWKLSNMSFSVQCEKTGLEIQSQFTKFSFYSAPKPFTAIVLPNGIGCVSLQARLGRISENR